MCCVCVGSGCGEDVCYCLCVGSGCGENVYVIVRYCRHLVDQTTMHLKILIFLILSFEH